MFAYPVVLMLLLVVVPVGVWMVVREVRGRRGAVEAFGEPALLERSSALPGRMTGVRRGLQLVAVVLGVLALARPQWGERPAALARTGRDVLVLLDLSRSMNVTDVAPSRLAAARRAAAEIVAVSPGDRVGLVVFGGSAFLQLPLTTDHAALRLFLDAASSDDLGDPATDLSAALAAAVEIFDHDGERGYQAVLLLSDGESVEGDLAPALDDLRRAAIPVFTVGVGTPAGGPVPADTAESDEPYHRDYIGRIVTSRLEEAELRRIADATGGAFARWGDRESLEHLTAELGRLAVRPLAQRKGTERTDRFQWPLGLAVVALVMESVTRRRGRRGYSALVAVAAVTAVGCSTAARQGERAYAAARWADAFEAFDRAHEAEPAPALAYNAGAALYRMERYADAVQRFRQAAAAPDPALRQRSFYNLGNAYVRLAESDPADPEPLFDAIAAYEQALRLAPADADAKWNLELALRRLGDDRVSGGSSGRPGRADFGRGDMNVPGYEGNPDAAVGAMAGGGFGSTEGESVEELSEPEARRLLDAVQREQLESHEGRPASRGVQGEKDW